MTSDELAVRLMVFNVLVDWFRGLRCLEFLQFRQISSSGFDSFPSRRSRNLSPSVLRLRSLAFGLWPRAAFRWSVRLMKCLGRPKFLQLFSIWNLPKFLDSSPFRPYFELFVVNSP